MRGPFQLYLSYDWQVPIPWQLLWSTFFKKEKILGGSDWLDAGKGETNAMAALLKLGLRF